jgi:hypothetical protein
LMYGMASPDVGMRVMPRPGLGPGTTRLKAGCSTVELTGRISRLEGVEPPTLRFEV